MKKPNAEERELIEHILFEDWEYDVVTTNDILEHHQQRCVLQRLLAEGAKKHLAYLDNCAKVWKRRKPANQGKGQVSGTEMIKYTG